MDTPSVSPAARDSGGSWRTGSHGEDAATWPNGGSDDHPVTK